MYTLFILIMMKDEMVKMMVVSSLAPVSINDSVYFVFRIQIMYQPWRIVYMWSRMRQHINTYMHYNTRTFHYTCSRSLQSTKKVHGRYTSIFVNWRQSVNGRFTHYLSAMPGFYLNAWIHTSSLLYHYYYYYYTKIKCVSWNYALTSLIRGR